jgi:carboxymethylenebutenolidase
MAAAAQTLNDAEVIAYTQLMLDRLGSLQGIDAEQWGCVGFCMGGRFALLAAARFGEALAAGALLHPSRLVTGEGDSPRRSVSSVCAAL